MTIQQGEKVLEQLTLFGEMLRQVIREQEDQRVLIDDILRKIEELPTDYGTGFNVED